MALRNQWVRLSVVLLIALLAKVVLGNPFSVRFPFSPPALFDVNVTSQSR